MLSLVIHNPETFMGIHDPQAQVSGQGTANTSGSTGGDQAFDVQDADWMESLEDVFRGQGPQRVADLLTRLHARARQLGVRDRLQCATPYVNTIPADQQPRYPGSRKIERRIKSIIRWNAMAMVIRANRDESGIGGHISSYASLATLLEVGFNHFFRGRSPQQEGDIVYFQGHSAPGVYARAFLEGRLTGFDLENFRRELKPEGGLPS